MKITHLIAAATMIAGLGVSTAANAQHRSDRHHRYDQRDDRRHYGYDRGRSYGYNRGRSYGYNRGRSYGYNQGRRCHTAYRHHRRVTVCYR